MELIKGDNREDDKKGTKNRKKPIKRLSKDEQPVTKNEIKIVTKKAIKKMPKEKEKRQ